MKKVTAAAIFLILFCYPALSAREPVAPKDIKFDKISVEQGLSQSTVFCITQDKKGFLWIGTLDGLNKYDGYNFTLYKSDPEDSRSLSHNYVFTIYEDSGGDLWIGTLGGGLNKFDRENEGFEVYKTDPGNPYSISNNNIRVIFEDSRGNLWVGTNNGLNKLDRKTGRFERYFHDPQIEGSISNDYIWSVYEDSRGSLYIGTYGGLNVFDYDTETFSAYRHDPDNPTTISNNYVWSVMEDTSGNLWVGTLEGLNLLDRDTGVFTRFIHTPGDDHSLSNNNVWSLLQDHEGNVWLATLGGGLNKIVYRNNNVTFDNYRPDPENPFSLSHTHVWSVFEDRSGLLWIGTDVGLNKYDREKEKFAHFAHNPFDKNSLCDNEVLAIETDDDNNYVWIGTRNGLDRYDLSKKEFRHFNGGTNKAGSLSSGFVRSLYIDREGTLWVGTNGGGLNRYNEKTGRFTNYSFGAGLHTISNNNITSITESGNGELWVGTLSGLNRFDRTEERFYHYNADESNPESLSHDYISVIHEDSSGFLWIGTIGGGLNRFDTRNEKFTRYLNKGGDPESLSNNLIFSIYESDNGDLWVGTNDGLNRFDRDKETFDRYSEKDGLANDVIYGILGDKEGNLWLSTNKGIAKFNPASGSIKSYSTDDGLQSYQFSAGASCKDDSGNMYFGGINGFNAFDPGLIADNPYVPNIVITDFRLFNKSVKAGNDSPLQKSVSETEKIELSYSQDVFSFEFAALHFSSPEDNRFAYKMEGFDSDWIYSGGRNFVTYTNLYPGEYIFRVKGSNNDGVWNNTGTSVAITIPPPFWMSWWFILGALLLVMSIIGSIIYFRIQQLLAVERLRLKIAQDLHDDIGTRLTEISMLSDMLYHVQQKNVDPGEKKTVKNIGDIARALIDNMSEIVWLINPKRDSLYELFLKLKDSYEELLSYSDIMLYINNFKFLEKIRLPMEYRRNLYLIFKEAMNNSLKYSGCSEISINSLLKGHIIEITLYDNGKGFDVEKECCGNGLENMKARAEAIGGELRINSKPGEGTMIKFTGKINSGYYKVVK